ncbi:MULTISPECIES: hypothetical protein [Halobacterium]|uniref:hypothetical protein n=1 Tax=Halobacterium TaxID=2239 RepID=UPI001E599268|nr:MULTISPECIES: hypothetical protein [Halobacterium]MDL0120265.1 hypothetical protein [Halobacterium salinarum]MDL0144887.1 hypothetical protein [Halobacterium salinarum]QRY25822.2 hypothetical protein JRZ79_00470 [Halobacterium sp. BOL4-2]WJK64118.1 hypothetical protein QSJ49_02885 [Halobacterium salinarum]
MIEIVGDSGAGLRELLAVVLGGVLGVAMVAAPTTVARLSVFLGSTRRRRHDGPAGGTELIPGWMQWVVRAVGIVVLGVAAVIAVHAV